jgi:transketolase
VVIEEHNIEWWLGDAVASVLSENLPTRLIRIGINDTFWESGSHSELWLKYWLHRSVMLPRITDWIDKI